MEAELAGGGAVEEQRRRWERKRSRTARELLLSERHYVEELELINKCYDEVFRARCGKLRIAQQGICGTIPSILRVNRSLLMCLERGSAGAGFETFSHYLHLYRKHGDCLENTLQAVQVEAKKNKSFARFIRLQETRAEFGGRSLEKLLQLPLQRMVRYRHYLLDLVENSLPGSRDSAQLSAALQAVSELCDHMEEVREEKKNQLQLQRVQKLLKGRRVRIISPGRRYIREGWLSLVPASGEDVKHRMLFLFSDVLAVTSPCHPLHPLNAHKFSCRALYPLTECRVERVLGHTQSQGGLISLSFCREKLLLMSDNQQDLNIWFECLLRAVRKLRVNGGAPSGDQENQQPFPEQRPNVSAVPRVLKRHVDAVRDDPTPQGETSKKRRRMSQTTPEGAEPPPQDDPGSGWSCTVL